MTDSPVIMIDTREQTPLAFEHLATERGTLQSAVVNGKTDTITAASLNSSPTPPK